MTQLNERLQIAATVGLIVGLLLVAYEIKVSNRAGIEQANAARFERWASLNEQVQSPDISELFVRAHQGESLTRAEAVRLQSILDTFLISLNYVFILTETDTVDYGSDFSVYHRHYIQFFLGSEFGRRYWVLVKDTWNPDFSTEVSEALDASEQREALSVLDYFRGATEDDK